MLFTNYIILILFMLRVYARLGVTMSCNYIRDFCCSSKWMPVDNGDGRSGQTIANQTNENVSRPLRTDWWFSCAFYRKLVAKNQPQTLDPHELLLIPPVISSIILRAILRLRCGLIGEKNAHTSLFLYGSFIRWSQSTNYHNYPRKQKRIQVRARREAVSFECWETSSNPSLSERAHFGSQNDGFAVNDLPNSTERKKQ